MPPFRYAVWAAVSTLQQAAADKYSISNQVASSRERANSKGWIETSGPYIVPGESRSLWTSLSDAAEAIPSLRQLLDDARAGRFDILIFFEYDRFRDLVDLVGMTLNHYGVQLYSVSQPSEPLQPDTFSPYASDSEPILRDVSKIASRIAINNMRRKYAENMPERVRSLGLNAISIPYGYRKPDVSDVDRRKAVPVQDPRLVPYVIAMKDLLLAGQSLRQIRDHLAHIGAPTPRGRGTWHSTVIRDILTNPFYAGTVRFGVSRVVHDLVLQREHRDRSLDPDRLITAPGRHIPLWDETTFQAILSEFRKRQRSYRGGLSQRLTGLLACDTCGARLYMHYNQRKDTPGATWNWRCSQGGASHCFIPDETALQLVIDKLVQILDAASEALPDPDDLSSRLRELRARKDRLIDIYETGDLDRASYISRIHAINADIASLEAAGQDRAGQLAETRQREQTLAFLREHRQLLPVYIRTADQQEINHVLHAIFGEIFLDRAGRITRYTLKTRL